MVNVALRPIFGQPLEAPVAESTAPAGSPRTRRAQCRGRRSTCDWRRGITGGLPSDQSLAHLATRSQSGTTRNHGARGAVPPDSPLCGDGASPQDDERFRAVRGCAVGGRSAHRVSGEGESMCHSMRKQSRLTNTAQIMTSLQLDDLRTLHEQVRPQASLKSPDTRTFRSCFHNGANDGFRSRHPAR